MISAGLEGRIPYMTYPEPWRGPPKQPPEFLRPAPKPIPPRYNGIKSINDQPTVFVPSSRYNGITTATTTPNGTRIAPSQRPMGKYSPPALQTPVNLTQHKDDVPEELPYSYRIYSQNHFQHFSTLYHQSPYAHMMRPNFPPSNLTLSSSPLETYSPTTAITSSTFLSPPATYSPPTKPTTIVREKRTPPAQQQQQQQPPPISSQTQPAFKVPSGKEGSLKHRILTRPEDNTTSASGHQAQIRNNMPLDLQKAEPRKRLNATMSPPRSPKKTLNNNNNNNTNNNNSVPTKFAKGSLIQLVSGELRRIEDLRTEDFVTSAEKCPELRLAESTVVRLDENPITGNANITLSYNQRRTQVDMESSLEHPYFVYGQGWASCSPERTQQCYGLKVHKLQVGDILISLTPREHQQSSIRTSTIVTTATTTAMTVRQTTVNLLSTHNNDESSNQPINLHSPAAATATTIGTVAGAAIPPHPPQSLSPESLAARKRRWSAPEQICDEDEQMARRHRAD